VHPTRAGSVSVISWKVRHAYSLVSISWGYPTSPDRRRRFILLSDVTCNASFQDIISLTKSAAIEMCQTWTCLKKKRSAHSETRNRQRCEIWGSYSRGYEEYSLLGCDDE
jgi:hypothetical protein